MQIGNIFNKQIHLSVNENSRLSLWDSVQDAATFRESHEMVITLTLTEQQLEAIELGAILAKQNRTKCSCPK